MKRKNRLNGFTLQELLVVITVLIILCSLIFPCIPSMGEGYFSKLFKVIFHNIGFWILLFVATIFGLYRKLTNPNEFLWSELPIQIGVSAVSVLGLFAIFFTTSTDLSDTEVWNGYVEKAEYYEEWTEKTVTKDSKGKKRTSYTHHPAEWKLKTTAGALTIDRSVYRNYRARFGDEKKKYLHHSDQSSVGDGNMYYVKCNANTRDLLPASVSHRFVNYLRASDSIKKIQGSISGFKDFLMPYPEVHNGPYGQIEFNRVVEAGINLPSNWKKTVNDLLNRELMTLGAAKQVNIIVYVAGTSDARFADALKESWIDGKKNDVIVILGVTKFPEIKWARVMAWTKIEEFKISLRNDLLDLKTIADSKALTSLIVNDINRPGEKGGFVRTPMSELEYLIADISLPWWCQVLIALLGGGVSWGTSWFLINNNWRESRWGFRL